MTPQKSVCFDVEYHGDPCDVQIGDVDTRKDVGRVGRNYASILITPPQVNCIYSCRCNDLSGGHERDNSGEGKEHLSILRIGKEVKNDLLRNNHAVRSTEFGKAEIIRCKKVSREKGSLSIDEDSSEGVRFCEVCLHACTITECKSPGRSKNTEEYLQGGRLTRKGMKVLSTYESNSLTYQLRKGSTSSSSPGGSAILKYLKKGKKKKKKKKRKIKEKSKGNVTSPVGEASKKATLLLNKNMHLGNDKRLNSSSGVVPSTREEKDENVMELSKGKPVNGLEGAIRISSHGRENAPKIMPLISCKSGRKVFRSHLKLHRLKCRSMKIIEKLKDAMIKENIAYNKGGKEVDADHEGVTDNDEGVTDNGEGDNGEADNDEGDNDEAFIDNDPGRGRGASAKRTKGARLNEADYLVYKFRRTLRRHVKKYVHKKIIILESFLQTKRNLASEKMVHTFIIPSISDRPHKNASNYCSYVDRYVRKFFHSYFVTLVNQFFKHYFFHYKRKCVKSYVGSFGSRGEKLDGETASHHQPFGHSRFGTKNDNGACSRVICSSCLHTSKANFAPSSGGEETSKGDKDMTEGRNPLPVFSRPSVSRNPNEGHGKAGRDPYSSYRSNCCNGELSVLEPIEGRSPSGGVLHKLHVERLQKEENARVSANPKRGSSPCGELKLGAANDPRGRCSVGGERTEGRVCGSSGASGDSGGSGGSGGNSSGNSGGRGNHEGGSSGGDSNEKNGGSNEENGGSNGGNGGSNGENENDGNSEDNNEDHNEDNNDDSGNDSSNESSNDKGKEKDSKGNNQRGEAHPGEAKEKCVASTHDNEHENYYKLIREIEFLENNENVEENTSVKKNDSIDAVQGGDEQKAKSAGADNCQITLDSGAMEKEEDGGMKLERSGEDNQLLNVNQMIIHTTSYVSQPLKLPLLPEMSHPNSYSSLSPRNNTCGSSSSSSSSGSSGSGGSCSSSGSGNSSTNSSGSCNNQGGKSNTNQLNDPDFEEACDIRLMNTPENMKFSQSPPTSSLHASSLHLTDVNELVLSPNQQIYSNSPLKSPNTTPLTPASPIFDSNYNEENMEKVSSNYFVSSPYRNDIFSEFDMLGSFFESLDELENKSDYTESSSNENSKFSHDFSLDMCGGKKGKKGNIQKDEVIYNFKRDNYKKVFHAWCNKGKHELNYDNKKFGSIMEWINYIEELMSHEGQNDNKGDEEEERQPRQEQQMGGQLGGQMGEHLEEEHCGLLHEMEHDLEHDLEHEREQEDMIKIGMSPNFFSEENVYQVGSSAFRSDEYMSVGKENGGGSDEVDYGGGGVDYGGGGVDYGGSGGVDYSVNSGVGVGYLVSSGVDYMVSSMADYAVSGGADCGNDQGEYYKDGGDNGALKEESKCDNFLASQNVNVMMSTPEQCNSSFVADNVNAYRADERGGGGVGMSSPHGHCALLSSSLMKPNYDANPCISNFGGKQNLLPEYNNAEDNITYCNSDSRQEGMGDYFLPSAMNGAQMQSGSCGVGCSGFVWNSGASADEGNGAGNIASNVANVANAANAASVVDNLAGNHHAHVAQPVGAEKVGAQNEKDEADNSAPSSNCADVPNPWMAQ
ncbi:conserved Plasmodium protein, unknown function [Plasmodium vivax]|uniref:Uncharacterized protein n=1 Tax=Plasmodium vivax TaxID=5855 RepID=A0A1G4H0V7_PLAVI|nr:conserved Plasmodium protein, unknown function [Plasmodium vivax]